GFSEYIRSTPKEEQAQVLLDLHSQLSDCYTEIKKLNASANFKAFTDNIVLAYPRYEDGEGQLGNIITSISEFQLNMTLNGYFVRGGTSLGDYYGDDTFAFGPALLEAHDLESIYAIHPRIAISNTVAALMGVYIKQFYGGSHAPQSEQLLLDLEDNIYFINYLYYIEDLFYDGLPVAKYLDMVMTHKEKIEAALEKYSDDPKIESKYSWVAKYHNHYCDVYLPSKKKVQDLNIGNYKISSLSSGNFISLYSALRTGLMK
ncbi:hypothetical protein CW734_01170, partial (plasmid) [Planococcus sp. MB-3u-03]